MTMIRESTVACRNCRFAAIMSSGYFDYYRFPLGGIRYWAVHFFFCMECGITHCYGSRGGLPSGERSDLFAQRRPLFLVKVPVTVWRGDPLQEFHELDDFIETDTWLPCRAAPDRAQQGRVTEDGIWYEGHYSCSVCKIPGTLAGLLDGRERLWRCPQCRQRSLGHSDARAGYKGMALSIGAEQDAAADLPRD
jgi:hypothetical protein